MNPFLVLLVGAVVVGAWPLWVIARRQRRARGTANDHLPGERTSPRQNAAHIDAVPPAEMDNFGPMP